MKRLLLLAALALVAPAEAAQAQISCTAGTDMTGFTGYVDCRGPFSGNINGSNTGEVGSTGTINGFGGQWAGNWKLVGKSDNSPNGWFDGGPNTAVNPDIIKFDGWLTGKFVVGVKQATSHSFYLFNWENQKFTAIDWRGVVSNQAGYSHINLYTVNGQLCDENCTKVPEPASAALVVSGLAGLAAVARRRRHQA